jgi:hypothetical protein
MFLTIGDARSSVVAQAANQIASDHDRVPDNRRWQSSWTGVGGEQSLDPCADCRRQEMVKPDRTTIDNEQSSGIWGLEMSGVERTAIQSPDTIDTGKRLIASAASTRVAERERRG